MTKKQAEERGSPPPGETLTFPAGFRWGVATASHQCEGGNANNQWARWEETGHIARGERSGLACDWWGQAERDFDLAQRLGLNALRLSLEWSRIEPRRGEWSAPALERYRRMLQALRDRGIEPMVTLHHFTHPLWFEDAGGFLAPDAVDRFTRYAARVVGALGGLCDFWCTVNEPNVYSIFGYMGGGVFPPGGVADVRGAIRAQATMARAHAAAYRAIHAIQPAARVGWAQHYNTFDPASPRAPLDHAVAGLQDAAFNDFFPRAVRTGAAAFPLRRLAGDLGAVRDTCDYVGINVYFRDLVRFDPRRPGELFGRRSTALGTRQGDRGENRVGEIYPAGIARAAERAAALGKPVYVTEHGVADREDRVRPWLLVRAAEAMHGALQRGVDLRGYYHWTLVDNFEWAEGWGLRFGLVALDVETQARTPRPSAALYGAIARANALSPAQRAAYR